MGAIVWDGQVSDVSIFPTQFQKSLTAKSRKPETVNFDGPPAALLGFSCRTRTPSGCRKTTEWPALFREINLRTAYDKCSSLGVLLDEIQLLAKQAGLS